MRYWKVIESHASHLMTGKIYTSDDDSGNVVGEDDFIFRHQIKSGFYSTKFEEVTEADYEEQQLLFGIDEKSKYDYRFVVKKNIGVQSEEAFGKPNEIIYQMTTYGFNGKDGRKWDGREIESLKNFWNEYGKMQTVFELYEELKEEQTKENAIHPTHYQNCSVECIDVMLMTFGYQMTYDFCVLNAFKYIWRYKNKNGMEDLKKARYYVNCAYNISNLPEAKYMCIQEVRNVDMILKKIEKENDL